MTRQREALERLCASVGHDQCCGEVPVARKPGRRSYGHLGLRAWGWWRSVTVPVTVTTVQGRMAPESEFRGALE
jgi:hypothetical protein